MEYYSATLPMSPSEVRGMELMFNEIKMCFKVYTNRGSTVEPPSKGHFGTKHSVHCRENVLFSEVSKCIIAMGIATFKTL